MRAKWRKKRVRRLKRKRRKMRARSKQLAQLGLPDLPPSHHDNWQTTRCGITRVTHCFDTSNQPGGTLLWHLEDGIGLKETVACQDSRVDNGMFAGIELEAFLPRLGCRPDTTKSLLREKKPSMHIAFHLGPPITFS
ncbi:hypothetical protein CONLIGDRAFT_180517 [Coniochaeta ligniaria NRRL 30616]|uniref:60S ribosomal protein L41 n=1 Tax=Coniochaeta ligniaria NRRL 30616 TaxID=1408157 RepID=A0A1J7JTZ0_9PEZI|nr:hypothetical protein CONLIGDRAFT_180517 [Coniochaeta ligniaria NRRL 30616]